MLFRIEQGEPASSDDDFSACDVSEPLPKIQHPHYFLIPLPEQRRCEIVIVIFYNNKSDELKAKK